MLFVPKQESLSAILVFPDFLKTEVVPSPSPVLSTMSNLELQIPCIEVKSVTYYTVCSNFVVERTGLGDKTITALRKWGNEINHNKA